MQLTPRQMETLEVIKQAGEKGIGFKALAKTLKVKGRSTLAQRLGQLRKADAVKSVVNGKVATYFIVG